MKIRSVEAKNILSFDPDGVELGIDPKPTVIVGPNGAGKTNIVRLLDLVSTAIDWADEPTQQWGQLTMPGMVLRQFAERGHLTAAPQTRQLIRVQLELTTGAEKADVLTFFRAAIVSAVLQERSNSEDTAAVDAWVLAEVTEARLDPLFHGTLVLDHEGPPDLPWEVAYEFALDKGRRFRWVLRSVRFPGIFHAPVEGLDSRRDAQFDRLADRLFGPAENQGTGRTVPSVFPVFDLGRVCPSEPGRAVNPLIQGRSGRVEQERVAWRRFAESAGISAVTFPDRNYSLAWALSRVLRQGLVFVGEQFRGVGTGGVSPRSANLYRREDLRRPLPRKEPSFVPARLFRLKTGGAADRIRFRNIQEMFESLAPGRA